MAIAKLSKICLHGEIRLNVPEGTRALTNFTYRDRWQEQRADEPRGRQKDQCVTLPGCNSRCEQCEQGPNNEVTRISKQQHANDQQTLTIQYGDGSRDQEWHQQKANGHQESERFSKEEHSASDAL